MLQHKFSTRKISLDTPQYSPVQWTNTGPFVNLDVRLVFYFFFLCLFDRCSRFFCLFVTAIPASTIQPHWVCFTVNSAQLLLTSSLKINTASYEAAGEGGVQAKKRRATASSLWMNSEVNSNWFWPLNYKEKSVFMILRIFGWKNKSCGPWISSSNSTWS